MDKNEFDERVQRLQDVGKIIDTLPAEIRSEAFGLLKGYVSGQNEPSASGTQSEDDVSDNSNAGNSLFNQFDHDKPSDNVRLIAAHLFQQYGSELFSADEVNQIATHAGITVPTRVDMTLRNAKENGKNLFMSAGDGMFKPTVYGEANLKDTYGVRKGNKRRQETTK